MTGKFVTALVLAGVVFSGACVAASDTPLEAGRKRFMQDCAACHGANGLGDGPAAAALQTKPSDLTGLARRNDGQFPEDYVRKVVDGRDFQQLAHGSVEMPVWGSHYQRSLLALSEARIKDRIDALVVYLESIQTP
jgi:mono/diheme cytochrome c family protein